MVLYPHPLSAAGTLQGMPDPPFPEPFVTPLLDIVGNKAIPWIERGGMQRVVIARESAAGLILPADVQVSQKNLTSRRTSVRGRRFYGNTAVLAAQWAEDDQEIIRVPALACVASGHADFQVGDYILHCPEGTFILVPSGVPQPRGERSHLEGKNRLTGRCDLLWLSPRGRRIQCWRCHSRGVKHEIPKGQDNVLLLDDRIVRHMDDLEEEALARRENYEKMFIGALTMLLLATFRDLQAGRFLPLGSDGRDKPDQGIDPDPILQSQEYIKRHLAAPLTVDRVASAVHLSERHFRRLFQAQTGTTFVDFVIQHRLEQAQLFLRTTDWSIGQISEFTGFRSVAYFHTLFRRRLNMSPSEYRRDNQNVETGPTIGEWLERI